MNRNDARLKQTIGWSDNRGGTGTFDPLAETSK